MTIIVLKDTFNVQLYNQEVEVVELLLTHKCSPCIVNYKQILCII